mgnify:CR=1 FL=1
MKKKLLSVLLSTAMVASLLVGCGSSAATDDSAAADDSAATDAAATDTADDSAATDDSASAGEGGFVGVAMPTKDLQRWNQDGSNMQAELEAAGYKVDIQYASNDTATQVSQIENMITEGVDVLVIASIDGSSLGTVMSQAKEAGIPVIAYDRLIMDSDAVSYYATFDNYMVGTKQGEYIRDNLDLDNAAGPFNLEVFTGDPGDNNANFFYGGAMDVLNKYIDEGKLVIKSGQKEFADVATANWSTETAQSRMENILASYYADGTKLDAVLCSNDSTALGVTQAIESDYAGKNDVLITGQDGDEANLANIVDGKQSMTVYKAVANEAVVTLDLAKAMLAGDTVDESLIEKSGWDFECAYDTESYETSEGNKCPSFLLVPTVVTKDNLQEALVDPGYYTMDDDGYLHPAN